ncbi:MAG: gluconate 2-dehydrogenase subunit 3 family protein [Hyphomicrobiaceae bacterium]
MSADPIGAKSAAARDRTAEPSRRIIITSAAVAAAYLWTPAILRAQHIGSATTMVPPPIRNPLPRPVFFSPAEFALLDEFAEMLIPEDEVSRGARAARVAWTLDERLAESIDPDWRQSWHDDLAEIDRLSTKWFGRTFVDSSHLQRADLMTRISRNEADPKAAGEYAFGTIKWSVADIYYRTSIGIHDDLKYQGNVYQEEFSGTDVSKKT